MKSSRVIATVTIGKTFEEMGGITHPLMRDYARRCQAEFVVFDQPRVAAVLGQNTYEKFQLDGLLASYERIAFVDTDILIAPDAPNVFELVPVGTFAAASEEGYSQSARHKRLTQEVLGPVSWSRPYFNSGVMVLDRAHAAVFDLRAPKLLQWATGSDRQHHDLSDQPYLNYRVNELDLPFLDLGYRFNHTRVLTDTKVRFRSHFVHYAGPSGHRYGTRIEQLRKDAAVFHSKMLLELSRKVPAYRWVADRLDPAFLRYLLEERLRARR
jgi:lipopolysaccharide biosynthesis glycosyltransferase